MKVLQFPLSRISIGFVAGILVVYYLKPTVLLVFSLLFVAVCAFTIAYFVSKRNAVNAIYFGLATYFLAFGIGASTQIIHTDSFQSNNYIHHESIFEKKHLVSVTVREKLRSSSFNDRYVVLVNQIDGVAKSGRLLLNVRKDSLNRTFEIGTHLQIKGSLYQNGPAKNPNQFDYGKYLENKQIYAQMYADVSEMKMGSIIEKDVWYYTSKLRTKIIRNLEKSNFNKAELHVAIALILGQQQDISPEIIKDYQYAGAVHILSVSGLHIGFILLFVTFLLKPFPNTRRGSFIKLIIILFSLSSFGLIAGLAPSVLRSVTMFSFVAIGMYLRRSTNIFHTLLVSILLILLFEPSFLFDVGFQLSYFALFFILWLQPLLAQLWSTKNKFGNYFWGNIDRFICGPNRYFAVEHVLFPPISGLVFPYQFGHYSVSGRDNGIGSFGNGFGRIRFCSAVFCQNIGMEHLVFEQNHQLDCFAGAIHLSGYSIQLAVVVECLFIDCCHDCLVQETQFQSIGFGVGWRDCLSSSVFSNPLDYPKSKGIGHFQFEKKHFDCRTKWRKNHFACQ